MVDDFKGYKGAIEVQVSKDALTGKYTVNTSKYSFGVKIGDDTYEYLPACLRSLRYFRRKNS